MDLEEIFEKYFEEPERRRNLVSIDVRLGYKDAPEERYGWLVLATVLLELVFLLLCYFQVFNSGVLVMWMFFVFLGAIFYWQYKPRRCKICSEKMIRQMHKDTMYYFCDTCKLKLETGIGVGD